MRTRKRRTGVWLPPDPYNALSYGPTIPVTSTDENIVKEYTIDVVQTPWVGTTIDIPLVGDFNQDRIVGESNTPQGATLADSRFGYSLQRVVGKLFIQPIQFNYGDTAPTGTYFVTAGIIVRRTDDVGDPLTIQTSPQSYDAQGDPWVWRRSWMLQNQPQAVAQSSQKVGWPSQNVSGAPGTLDGPHIDQKTKRTIKQEERLYLHITATPLDGDVNEQISTPVHCWHDLRFFGRVFQSAGNRRNASR